MRKDLEEFNHYKRATSRVGVPFLEKTSKNGKCHVHWSEGTLSDYNAFQLILKGPLGKHMDSQIKEYFDILSPRSKAELFRTAYSGYFGPIDCAMASDVFAIVAFHFNTALKWMVESEIKGEWTDEKWKARVEYIDKKNADFVKFNKIEIESEMRDGIPVIDSVPWTPCSSVPAPAASGQPDIQQLTYRVFELIEPAIKQAIAQAIQEHFES